MSAHLLLCLLAIGVDGAMLGLLVTAPPEPALAAAALMLHGLASLLFARQLVALLPAPYQSGGPLPVAFVFGAVLFVPVFAMLGFLCSVWPALRRQCAVAPPLAWRHPRAVQLPTRAPDPRVAPAFAWAGSLAGTLHHATDPHKRMAALMATLSLQEQDAIPLWRWALKDPEDEVRLLAYSLLNRKERAIEGRIRDTLDRLDAAGPDRGPAVELHKALAHDWWALSQLAPARSSTQRALQSRARERAERALALQPGDGGLWLLLARILIEQRQMDEALVALGRARAGGIDARQTELLLAQMAFIDQRYDAVGRHIARTGPQRSRSRLGAAVEQWEGRGHAAVPA